jgi:hypothetical protein
MFSSTGLLYIGYSSKNKIQGSILGAIGTLPLFFIITLLDLLGLINGEGLEILLLFLFLAIGAFCGLIGAYIPKPRKKTIEQKVSIGKNKFMKKPHKGIRNKK